MPDLSTYIALTSLSVSALKTAEQQPGFSGSNIGGGIGCHTKVPARATVSLIHPLLHLSGKPKCVMHEMFAPLVSTEVELAL